MKAGDGGGAGRRRRAPAAAQCRRRPNTAFQGRIRAGPGPRSTYAACVSHWWALRGVMVTGRGCATVGAARRGEVSPAQARAATGGALRLKQLAQKHGEELGMLTELCIEGGGRRRAFGGDVRRWRTGGARGGRSNRGRCGSQQARGSSWRSCAKIMGVKGGSGSPAAENLGG